MGVGRPSLYSIFGDKRTLFLRILRAYAEAKGARAAKALFSPPNLRDSIAGFLRDAVENATEEGSAPGCLLVCVAPLVNDAEVRQFLQDAVAAAVALVERRFCDAISAGEIPSDFPVAVRASQVLDLGRGLTMRAQMGTSRKTLLRDAEEAADFVGPAATWTCGARTLICRQPQMIPANPWALLKAFRWPTERAFYVRFQMVPAPKLTGRFRPVIALQA